MKEGGSNMMSISTSYHKTFQQAVFTTPKILRVIKKFLHKRCVKDFSMSVVLFATILFLLFLCSDAPISLMVQ